VPVRSPLPGRAKRVVNPGAPDMPRPKRTSAEVSKAITEKALIQLRIAELEAEKVQMLAQMEIDEDEEAAEEEAQSIRTIAD
ncbi:hypothetical protein B0H10DRAFT_1691441, partial [Mycena sp. CBHHK59/15]